MTVIRCACPHHLHDDKGMQACKRCGCKIFKQEGSQEMTSAASIMVNNLRVVEYMRLSCMAAAICCLTAGMSVLGGGGGGVSHQCPSTPPRDSEGGGG